MTKSTTATRSTRITVGIDLGDKHSVFHALDGDGGFLEEGRVATTTAAFQHKFASFAPARIVLEAGTHSPWVSRLLKACGHEAVVVDPRKLELISRRNKKTDRHDASTLASLGSIDANLQLLKTISHRPEQFQADLAVMRARDALVRARTLLINDARGLVKSAGGRLPSCGAEAFPRKALRPPPSPDPQTFPQGCVPGRLRSSCLGPRVRHQGCNVPHRVDLTMHRRT